MSGEGTPGPEDKPDLRYSEHEGRDVKVTRDLSGEGHLARGDRTRMSRLNFSARARPADPGERDVSAFGGRVTPPTSSEAAANAPTSDSPADAQPSDSPADAPGLLERMGRLFGR